KEIYLNPLFDEEIISIKIDPHHFNAESDLIESLLNHDCSIISSSLKIDSLLDEFLGELTLLKSIPPGMNETDCDPEEEIRLIKKFLYDNSSPRLSKEFILEISDAAIKSFSLSPILVEDSDFFMKEIDLSFTPDDPMPPGIEEDDYDSERDILILAEVLGNDSFLLLENGSFRFDIPSYSRPPAKPPDGTRDLMKLTNEEEKQIMEEQAAKARYWKIPICYDDDEDYTIAITPILSTKKPDNSLNQFGDLSNSNDDSTSINDDSFSIDNIEYVKASPPDSELVSLEVMEIVIPEVRGIDDDILLTIKDDILREKLVNVNLFIANIKALKDNHTSYSDFMTKSSSTSLNFLLEETNTFDNSLPESETFCFDLEETSSGSSTTRSDISLPEYKAFYDDHVKEISSDSTTTHSDCSLYDSFIFDLSINPFPPAGRSKFYHEEFTNELAHIISPPEYDCFCFKNEPNLGDFTMDVVEDIFPIREPRV
nr:hypothetical protein [Tanacetum cinerariifolium]